MYRVANGLTVRLLAISFVSLLACGKVQNTAGFAQRDPVPVGAAVLAQGRIEALSGQTVSGSATVYRLRSGSPVLRLSGFTGIKENGLQFILTSTDGQQVVIPVRAGATGNLNFPIPSRQGTANWTQLRIYSPRTDQDYAQAILLQH